MNDEKLVVPNKEELLDKMHKSLEQLLLANDAKACVVIIKHKDDIKVYGENGTGDGNVLTPIAFGKFGSQNDLIDMMVFLEEHLREQLPEIARARGVIVLERFFNQNRSKF